MHTSLIGCLLVCKEKFSSSPYFVFRVTEYPFFEYPVTFQPLPMIASLFYSEIWAKTLFVALQWVALPLFNSWIATNQAATNLNPTVRNIRPLYGKSSTMGKVLFSGQSCEHLDTKDQSPFYYTYSVTSKVTTPQDAHWRLVLWVYLGSNTLELSASGTCT